MGVKRDCRKGRVDIVRKGKLELEACTETKGKVKGEISWCEVDCVMVEQNGMKDVFMVCEVSVEWRQLEHILEFMYFGSLLDE